MTTGMIPPPASAPGHCQWYYRIRHWHRDCQSRCRGAAHATEPTTEGRAAAHGSGRPRSTARTQPCDLPVDPSPGLRVPEVLTLPGGIFFRKKNTGRVWYFFYTANSPHHCILPTDKSAFSMDSKPHEQGRRAQGSTSTASAFGVDVYRCVNGSLAVTLLVFKILVFHRIFGGGPPEPLALKNSSWDRFSLARHYNRRAAGDHIMQTIVIWVCASCITSAAAFVVRGGFPRPGAAWLNDIGMCRAGLLVTLSPVAYFLLLRFGALCPSMMAQVLLVVAHTSALLVLHVSVSGAHGRAGIGRLNSLLALVLFIIPAALSPGAWDGHLDGGLLDGQTASRGGFRLDGPSFRGYRLGLAAHPAGGNGGSHYRGSYHSAPLALFSDFVRQRYQVYRLRRVWPASPMGTALWAWNLVGASTYMLFNFGARVVTLQDFKKRLPCRVMQLAVTTLQVLHLAVPVYTFLAVALPAHEPSPRSRLIAGILSYVIPYAIAPLSLISIMDATHEAESAALSQAEQASAARAQAEQTSAQRSSFLRYVFHEVREDVNPVAASLTQPMLILFTLEPFLLPVSFSLRLLLFLLLLLCPPAPLAQSPAAKHRFGSGGPAGDALRTVWTRGRHRRWRQRRRAGDPAG